MGVESRRSQDLFLSYSSADREEVLEVRAQLETLGVSTFLDRSNLNPGRPWPQELEDALASCQAVAVFVGSRPELGAWQLRESWMALDRQAREQAKGESFPVVPVLLPGADPGAGFLFLNTWIDLRGGVADREAIDRLIEAVRSTRPAAEGPRPEYPDICPYRGLEPFRRQDEPFFFGREAFTQELLQKVLIHDLVAVVGPSGSGKSSVVQAGLLPEIGRHSEGRAWEIVTMRPGRRPFRALGRQLIPLMVQGLEPDERLARGNLQGDRLEEGTVELPEIVEDILDCSNGSSLVLLVVDQFEELFREAPAAQRRPFVKALLDAGQSCKVVLTLRADFYNPALELSRELADALTQGQINIGPLRPAEIEEVVVGPARRVGLGFAEGLPTTILADVGEGHTALPLLEYCLEELWKACDGTHLTHAGYEEIGGVQAALAGRAQESLERLGPRFLPTARRLFTDRLVRVAEHDEAGSDTRRVAQLSDLTSDERRVVDAFAAKGARLLVTDQDTVEIVHEALIERWETLRDWLTEERSRLLARQMAELEGAWDKARSGVVLDGAFLERPAPFLESVEEALHALSVEPSPFTRVAEALWRLDFLAAEQAPESSRRDARDLRQRLVDALREGLERRTGFPPPTTGKGLTTIDPGRTVRQCGGGPSSEASFCMGSENGDPRERPVHPVVLSRYQMQVCVVTQGEYRRFEPGHAGGAEDDERLPITGVSWWQAYAYAAWLGGRLPTEAEWECACRAGTSTDWSFGNDTSTIDKFAWVDTTSGMRMHRVGELAANQWGLFDMHGNVWEWVADLYGEYGSEPVENPLGPAFATSGRRVFRGGSFAIGADFARSAYRSRFVPGYRDGLLGFRVVLPAPCRDSKVDPGS